jgi:hypothetical protein
MSTQPRAFVITMANEIDVPNNWRTDVRNALALLIFIALLGASAPTPAAGEQSPQAASAATPSVDEVVRAVRSDLQSKRTEVIAKNVTLTAEQSTVFWPLFNQYQQEQNAIMDEQMKEMQRYVDLYQTLDDVEAIALVNAHLERDARMAALRQRWFGEFLKVLPAKLAVRVIQIDRRISLTHQIEFASRIPLAP